MSLVRPGTPPGRSLTVAMNRTSRPSAAKPRSITRPNTVMSMFPPQRGVTTRLVGNSNESVDDDGSGGVCVYNLAENPCDSLHRIYSPVWPLSSGSEPSSRAANPVAPPPSTTLHARNESNGPREISSIESEIRVLEIIRNTVFDTPH